MVIMRPPLPTYFLQLIVMPVVFITVKFKFGTYYLRLLNEIVSALVYVPFALTVSVGVLAFNLLATPIAFFKLIFKQLTMTCNSWDDVVMNLTLSCVHTYLTSFLMLIALPIDFVTCFVNLYYSDIAYKDEALPFLSI